MLFAPVIRRSAFSPTLRSLDRFFDETVLAPVAATKANHYSFEQNDKAYTLSFDMPGIAKDQLSIGIEGNIVRLESKPDAPRKYKVAYELPQDIDVAASVAQLEHGVLTLKLAKQVPAGKVTELAIN